ncbi:25677_t:CDS:2 [Gigaspora margarita]|uniref:25677_t:CDS:1 n=1 Tax=Gigaspora margarita TaxID=4874 RepID=A0ABN7UM48_GIGMA|nr:25677_t:CDS:2 [Gigaspora margarita]
MDDLIEISNSEIAYPITLTNASVLFSQNSSLPFDPISNSIDFILRAFLVLIYGVPPSELILEFLSKNILKSRYISISIRTK